MLPALICGFMFTSSDVHKKKSKFTYEGDFSETFLNPERGFHKQIVITRKNDFSFVKDLGSTVVRSYIPIYSYLNMTKENPWNEDVKEKLPDKLLEDLQTCFDAIRKAGLKIILRPAYAWNWTPPVVEHWDSVIKHHIAQINDVVSQNADVVMALEAGIIGPWGEWHSDGIYTDPKSQKGADFRYELFKYILDTTPDGIPIRSRYPYFIKEILYLTANPPENQTALTQSQTDRIAYHDDSFMADINDWGSYNARNVWWGKFSGLETNRITNDMFRTWMYDIRTSFGGNILMGGETEWAKADSVEHRSTVEHEKSIPPLRVLTEMANLHTTEISADYNPKHVNLWKETNVPASDIGEPAESVYDRINRRMGYRLRLTEAEMTTTEKAGGVFEISARIVNDGYAGIVKERPAYIVLDGGKNRYDMLLDGVDVRLWLSGFNSLEASFTIPKNIPKGVYTVAIWLPDAAENLRSRPEYSVRFANKNVWNHKTGYNKLGEIVIF